MSLADIDVKPTTRKVFAAMDRGKEKIEASFHHMKSKCQGSGRLINAYFCQIFYANFRPHAHNCMLIPSILANFGQLSILSSNSNFTINYNYLFNSGNIGIGDLAERRYLVKSTT